MKPKRPISEWVITLIVSMVVLIVVAQSYVVAAITLDKSGLSFFITLIFLAALVKSYLDVRYVDRQICLSNKQVKELWDVKKIDKFIKNSSDGIFHNHIHNLHRIYVRDDAISQDNLVGFLQTNLFATKLRVCELIAGLLVTMGLVGTVIGLIGSVGGIGGVIDSIGNDSDALLGSMKETLGGMGTAFYTTLLGAVLGGVVLKILNNIVENNINYLVAHVAELSEIYILPALRSHARQRGSHDTDNKA